MTYKQIKAKHNLTDASIAEMFSYKNTVSFTNSSAKKRIEKGLESLYKTVASNWIKSKDALPKDDEEVLVWGGAKAELGIYKGVWMTSDEEYKYSSIEYWMPLPKAPNN